MLDRLPDELLLAVMAHLDSPSPCTSRYSARQRDLGALCLASRRLCRLAQPALQQQATVTGGVEQLTDWLAQPEPARGAVQRNARAVKVHTPSPFGLNLVAFALQSLTSLQELKLVGENDGLALDLLRPHPNLRRLCLDGLDLDERHCVPFPLLEILHLRDTYLSDEFAHDWLTPASFPSLKVLNPGDMMPSAADRLFAALPNLELVQCWWPSDEFIARHGDGDNPTFLFELDVNTLYDDEIRTLPRHVLLRTEDPYYEQSLHAWECDLLEALPLLTKLVKRQTPTTVDGQGGTLVLPSCILDLEAFVDDRADDDDGDSDDALNDVVSEHLFDRNVASDSGSDSGSDSDSDLYDSSDRSLTVGGWTPSLRTLRLHARLVAACARAGRTILYDECDEPHEEFVNETFWAHLRRTRRARDGLSAHDV